MLEKLPTAVGRALRNTRPGLAQLVYNDASLGDSIETIRMSSSAFGDGGKLPTSYTADGEKVSPPLAWEGVPAAACSLVLLVEDADSPTPHPLVHAIVWDLAPRDGELAVGALGSDSQASGAGLNSLMQRNYLPPDPPREHGVHHYAFQLLACDSALDFDSAPGRTRLLEALRGHVIAKGCLVGTYERV
jgi:Raf kinase inhibitor-like YbhB/YbcL family protein